MNFIKLLMLTLCLLTGFNATAAEPLMCNGGRFEPCVCWGNVTKDVSYSPVEKLCRNKAAIYIRGKLYNSYSSVVRDTENRDRWPASKADCGLNSCSVFKTQKIIKRVVNGIPEKVLCLGASGHSTLFKKVVRITTKASDIPNKKTGLKDIRRYCLRDPKLPLN